jgi:hypothetical protein
MPTPQYAIRTEADVALTAAALEYVLGVKAGTSFSIELLGFGFELFGISPTNEPILVELCYATFATNAPGTNSTSVTPQQYTGRVTTHGMTAARDWTAAPTAITAIDEWSLHPQQARDEWIPLDSTWDTALGEGFVLRATAPNAVDCRAKMKVRRC